MGGARGRKPCSFSITNGFGKFIIDGGNTTANQEGVGGFILLLLLQRIV